MPFAGSIQKYVFPKPAQPRLPALPTQHRLGRDHKSGAPFLGLAVEELGVMRQVRNHHFEPLHSEIANRIRRYRAHRFGLEDSTPVRPT
jgi:hypothetical protein